MFDKFIILIILLLLIYLTYRQFKIYEKFENDKSFIGMRKGDTKTLVFYNTSNRTNDKYQMIQLPNRESIKQYLYDKGIMVVLTNDNKIYYCMNCDLISGDIKWNQLELPTDMASISRVALNNQQVFVLTNGVVRSKNLTSESNWESVAMPAQDATFKYMDAQYDHLVGIGSLTNYIYHKDITSSGLSANWTILDKSKILSSIKVTLHGYLGKGDADELYQCKFPCDGVADNKWNLINSGLSSSINANSEVISMIKNNTLFSCNKNCSPDSIQALTDPNKYNLYSGSVIDFVYPKLELLPTLAPLDENKLVEVDGKLKNKINTHQEIDKIFTNINQKLQQFDNSQLKFNNQFNNLSQIRNDSIKSIMNKIGVSYVEEFSDSLGNVMDKINTKITTKKDEKEKKGNIRTNLIIAL
jgi:hypothetical protein